MSLETLSIDLNANLAAFTASLGKAAHLSEQTAAKIASALGVITSAAGGLTAGVGVGGLIALTKSSIDSLDALNDLADATGASVENISALEDIAARTGTTMDTVTTGLIKFNGILNDAEPGSKGALALERLNLSIKELRGLDPAEALRRTSVALAGFADDGDRARLVQELFGKSTRDVAAFLKDLSTQGSLVAKVTAEQTVAAEKFNQQLMALQKNAQDLTRIFASDLVTGINNAVDALRRSGLLEAVQTLVTGDDRYKNNKALTQQTEILLNLEKALQDQRAQGYGETSRVVTNTKAQIDGIKEQIRITQNYRKVLDDFSGANASSSVLPSVGSVGGKPIKGRTEREAGNNPVTTDLDRYMASLDQTIEREQQLTAVQTAQIRISEAGALGFSEAQRERILFLAAEIDKYKEMKQALQLANEAQDERIRIGREVAIAQGVDNGPRADRLKALLSNTDEDRFSQIRKDVALLAEEFETGRLPGGVEQYKQAVQSLIADTGKAATATKSIAQELGLTFESAFESAISGGKDLQTVIKGIAQDVLRIGIRETVTKPLAGYFSGLFSSLLPSFAVGTPYVPHDMVAQIHKGERIVPAAQNRAGMGAGGLVLANNIQVAGGVSQGELHVAIARALQENNRLWGEALRTQGVLS